MMIIAMMLMTFAPDPYWGLDYPSTPPAPPYGTTSKHDKTLDHNTTAIDPNYLMFSTRLSHLPYHMIAGQYSKLELISHPCSCLEFPLPQGRMVLPCKKHDELMQKTWKKFEDAY